MPKEQKPSKSPSLRAVHGRGLAIALLLSALMHGFWLTKPSQWLPFAETKTPPSAWSTRWIPAEINNDVATPLSAVSLPPALSSPVRPVQPAQAAPLSASKPNLNENQPIALINPVLSAIETVVNAVTPTQVNAPVDQPVDPSSVVNAGSLSEPVSEPELVRLEYPGDVSLAFEGVFSRQGVQRKGVGQLQWKSDGVSYDMSLQASYFGITLLSQSSVGSLAAQGLEPLRYGDRRGVRSEQAAHFRRENAQIEFSNNKPAAALLPGAQDRLSVIMQLAALLLGDAQRHLTAKRIVLQVAGIDDAQVWEFVIEGAEPVTLPTKQVQALRLQRKPRDEFDQRLEIWLAAELGYLPVRIKQSAITSPDKDFTDLVLSKLP